MPLPSPKARVPPKVTNIFDICFIYITSFIVVITPPFKTFTPPICICFWHRRYGGVFLCVFIFRKGDHRSPLPIFLSPPLSRFCRQLPSMGAIQNASPWGEVARSDGMVVKNNVDVPSLFPFSKSVGAIIGRPLPIFLSPPLSRLCRQLPSMGALQNASPWGEVARSDGVVAKNNVDVPSLFPHTLTP